MNNGLTHDEVVQHAKDLMEIAKWLKNKYQEWTLEQWIAYLKGE